MPRYRVNKPRVKRGRDDNDINNLKVFFYVHMGYQLVQAAKKFDISAGAIYNKMRITEDNFCMGAYCILNVKTGSTKDRPDKDYLQIKVGIKKQNGSNEIKTFCYDRSKPQVDILEEYIKEELYNVFG